MDDRLQMNETTTASQTLFDGRIVKLELHEVLLADGTQTQREIIRHAAAVAVLVYHQERRCYLLVEQFRKPFEQTMLEVVAGLQEAGESPEETVRRELLEETGYEAATLQSLGQLFPSPGYVDEVIHLFYAEVAGRPDVAALDEDERICVSEWAPQALEESLTENRIKDAKTVAIWYLHKAKTKQHHE